MVRRKPCNPPLLNIAREKFVTEREKEQYLFLNRKRIDNMQKCSGKQRSKSTPKNTNSSPMKATKASANKSTSKRSEPKPKNVPRVRSRTEVEEASLETESEVEKGDDEDDGFEGI
jgi:hypothetical protein